MNPFTRLPAMLTRPAATALEMTTALVALPGRVIGLVIAAEEAMAAVKAAVARTDELIDRVDGVTVRAQGALTAAEGTVAAAAVAIEQAGAITATAAPLMASYSEPLRRLEPAVRKMADTTGGHEVDALVTLLARLPRLADAMDGDVLPLLARLDQIGPDVNQLLDSVSDLNRMAGRLPKVFRRHRDPPSS
ncbi:MAG TPA: hypothetical protein VIY28_03695 [Pseudonocardiaceae bacterium]